MNKKQLKARKQAKKVEREKALPMVSICTPTFNRRPFFSQTIQCYLSQDYPRDKLEWIIIDDGTDPIGDMVKDIEGVQYFYYETKMPLGKKRNLMHRKSKGSIIVYMDDDDFYPPERVSHAVDTLKKHPDALCAGSSQIYIWFNTLNQMYRFGPYGPNHATAGTFAFRRELLKQTEYEEHAALAEEKHFLKNYTIPFVQLDPIKTILVFSHEHNTFDKRKLLENKNPQYVNESSLQVKDFIKNAESREFYMSKINELLKDYELGTPENKPDVMKQTKEIEEKRRQEAMKNGGVPKISIQKPDGSTQDISIQELVEIVKKQQEQLVSNNTTFQQMNEKIQEQMNVNRMLLNDNTLLRNELNKAIEELKKYTDVNVSQVDQQTQEEQPPKEKEVITISL